MANEFWHKFPEEPPTEEGLYLVYVGGDVMIKHFTKRSDYRDGNGRKIGEKSCSCFCGRNRMIATVREVEHANDVLCWAQIPDLPDYCNPRVLEAKMLQKQIDQLQEQLRRLTKEDK